LLSPFNESLVEGGKRADQKPHDEHVAKVDGHWRIIDRQDLRDSQKKDCGIGDTFGSSGISPGASETVSVDNYKGILESPAVQKITE
jgi:hypothetical protein